jgi:hypothetical protein
MRKGVLIGIAALLALFGIFYFVFFRHFWGTSGAVSDGSRIYAELQQAEKDVRAGKITSPEDPELTKPQQEIDQIQKAHANAPFNDAMLFSSLDSYDNLLGTLADLGKSGAGTSSTARANVENALATEKKEIEGYLGNRFKIQ